MTTQTDAALMESVAKADARAFACLMQRHLKKSVALAQRIVRNEAVADEMTQEAFLRLWIKASKWDGEGTATVRTWLSRVIVNLCLDHLRRKKSVPLEDAGELIDPSDIGYDSVQKGDQRRLVQKMLGQLPPRQRVAVILAYFEDLSGADIAKAMDVSVRAVESLLVRARRALRDDFLKHGIVGNEDI